MHRLAGIIVLLFVAGGLSPASAYYKPPLGGWTATAPLPDTYTSHAMVRAGDCFLHLGGLSTTNGLGDGDKVFYAQVTGPGTIAPWVQGPAMPQPSFLHAAVASGNYIYVLGGQHYDGLGVVNSNHVYISQIGQDGVPSPWQTTTVLPESLYSLGALVSNGRIYVTGGLTTTADSDRVYSAVINPDGTLGSWVSLLSLPTANYGHAVVAQDGTIYLLGGAINNGSDLTNAVYVAPILPDGTVGPWVATTPLPEPVGAQKGAVIGSRIYVVGGWTGTVPTTAVRSAQILPDKTLGAWQSEPSLPVALYLHGGAANGQAILASGGHTGGAPQSAVYGLPVATPPCPEDLDGDGLVNSTDLTLLLGAWAAGTAAGDIDGDGDTDSADLTLLLGAWAAGGCP